MKYLPQQTPRRLPGPGAAREAAPAPARSGCADLRSLSAPPRAGDLADEMVQPIRRVAIGRIRWRAALSSREARVLRGEQKERVDAIGDLAEEGGVRRDYKKSCSMPKAIPATAKSLLTDVYLLVLQKK